MYQTFIALYGEDTGAAVLSLMIFAFCATALGILVTFLLSRSESNKEANDYIDTQKKKFEIEKQRTDTFMMELNNNNIDNLTSNKNSIDEKNSNDSGNAGNANTENNNANNETTEERKRKIDLIFEEIIDISLKLETMADETLNTLYGKFSGFIEHCFAFSSAYGWKEAIYSLMLLIYDNAYLIIVKF